MMHGQKNIKLTTDAMYI